MYKTSRCHITCLCVIATLFFPWAAMTGSDSRITALPHATGWAFRIGEPSQYFPDYLAGAALTPDGAFLLVGTYDTYDDGWVIKAMADGSVGWQERIGAPYSDDYFESVDKTSDGGFILGGGSVAGGEDVADGWIVKLRSNGKVAWSKRYRGPWLETIARIFQLPDGTFLSAGWAFDYLTDGSDGQNPWLQKLDKNGKIVWQKIYIGGEEYDGGEMTAVTDATDGGALVAGSTGEYNSADGIAIRVDSSGEIIWQKRFAGKSNDQIEASLQTSDGGFLLVGSTRSFGSTLDPWAIKLDSGGEIAWQYRYKGSSDYLMKCVAGASDGGFLLMGCGVKTKDLLLIKIGADGRLGWQKVYDYPLDGLAESDAISLLGAPSSGYVATGSADEWGNPWAAQFDSSGVIGTCPSKPWKLTTSKTNVKILTPSYTANDPKFNVSTVVKDKVAKTDDEPDPWCR